MANTNTFSDRLGLPRAAREYLAARLGVRS